MVKKRKLWIDALRAIAMIFVIIWHISSGVQGQWIYNLFTSPIMIPLFLLSLVIFSMIVVGIKSLLYKRLENIWFCHGYL